MNLPTWVQLRQQLLLNYSNSLENEFFNELLRSIKVWINSLEVLYKYINIIISSRDLNVTRYTSEPKWFEDAFISGGKIFDTIQLKIS